MSLIQVKSVLLLLNKNLSDTKVGDTICEADKPLVQALPGFKPSKPVVFCGLFPVDSSEYQKLKDGLAKLQLNDASFSYEAKVFFCAWIRFSMWFSWLIALRDYYRKIRKRIDINLLTTTPGVVYKVHLNKGEIIELKIHLAYLTLLLLN